MAVFRDRCTGVTTSLEMAALYALRALCWMGQFAELRRRRRALLKEAEERQDWFSLTNYRTEVMSYDRLADDQPEAAALEIDEVMSRWSQRGFHAQHLFALIARLRVDLYGGQGAAARRRMHDAWPAYKRSQLHRSSIARIVLNQLIASGALASWSDHAHRGHLDREASAAADRLDRERIGYAGALALMLRGRLDSLRGDHARAIRAFRTAAEQFQALEMPLQEAATRFRLGEMLPPEEGRDLTRTAIDWLESQSIRNPEAMIRMVLP